VVQISAANTWDWIDRDYSRSNSHTLALTESGRLYSFGAGTKGQLGVKLVEGQEIRATPERVDIDLA
jgi:alpha-tubulin suppressor-like RCC1 family protein